MALAPISYIATNYTDYATWWLKPYTPGTTTPKPGGFALDVIPSGTVAKLEINVDGFLVTAGSALLIPFIDGAYDLWLFPTEADADANDTSSALQVADNITASDGTNISTVDIDQGVMDWDTTVTYKAGAITKSPTTPEMYRSLVTQSGNDPDTAYSGTSWNGTSWGYDGGHQVVNATEYGPLLSDLKAALAESLVRKTWCDCAGVEYEIDAEFIMPQFTKMRNFRLKFTANVAFRGDHSCSIVDGNIDGNGIADYGLQEVTGLSSRGMIRGLIKEVRITGCLIDDLRLSGYHWLLKIDGLYCSSSSNSGWGIFIDNYTGNLNPDITITNTYVDALSGGGDGMRLDDGQYHVSGCSADNTGRALSMSNSFIVMNSVGFEQFSSSCFISSSQLMMNQCTMTAAAGSFTDDGGQRAFITSSGGTIAGSVSLNGGIYQNNSTDPVALIRGSSITPPEFLKIGADVEKRLGGGAGALTDYIYQSTGTPSISVAQLSYLGESRTITAFGGMELTGTPTLFPIYLAPNIQELTIYANSTARYFYWREVGADTAGAATDIDFVVYNNDGTEKSREVSAIAIAGVAFGQPKRTGTKILDLPLVAGEYVAFETVIGGERINTGVAITLVIDQRA